MELVTLLIDMDELINKYMKDYNKNDPPKYVMYLYANNLYGWAMSQYLPTGGFRWMTKKEISKTNLAKYKEDSKKGTNFSRFGVS